MLFRSNRSVGASDGFPTDDPVNNSRRSTRIRRPTVPHHPPASLSDLSPISSTRRQRVRRRLLGDREEEEEENREEEEDVDSEEDEVDRQTPRRSPRLAGQTSPVDVVVSLVAGQQNPDPDEAAVIGIQTSNQVQFLSIQSSDEDEDAWSNVTTVERNATLASVVRDHVVSTHESGEMDEESATLSEDDEIGRAHV